MVIIKAPDSTFSRSATRTFPYKEAIRTISYNKDHTIVGSWFLNHNFFCEHRFEHDKSADDAMTATTKDHYFWLPIFPRRLVLMHAIFNCCHFRKTAVTTFPTLRPELCFSLNQWSLPHALAVALQYACRELGVLGEYSWPKPETINPKP